MTDFEPIVINAAAVQSRPVSWLWHNVIPRGKLTVLCGDPGLGKSFLTLDLASRASRGGPWPMRDEPADTASAMRVVLLSAEDDPADTIRPRLEAMGADLSKIDILDSMVDSSDRVHEFTIGEHSTDLASLLGTTDPAGLSVGLLVVDPVSAYVGGTDSYNNAQVRAMLKPLSDLAADHNVAVVLVTHMRKAEATKALHGAMGSLAFTAAARVVLLVSRDRHNPDLRQLLTVKSNLAPDRTGYRYTIDDGKVRWVDTVEGQADEVLSGKDQPRPEMVKLIEEVRAKLKEGPLAAEDVRKLAEAGGISWSLASKPRFKEQVGAVSKKVKDGWVWVLGGQQDSKGQDARQDSGQDSGPLLIPEG